MGIKYCDVCNNKSTENSVVCSDACQEIRLKMFKIGDKYAPTHGCDNCWGDLHQGCSSKCKEEFRLGRELSTDLWELVHLVTKKNTKY